MIGYGEWLESLLDKNLSQWAIADLINKASSLLKINYSIRNESYFIQLIEKINLNEKETLGDGISLRYDKLIAVADAILSFTFTESEEYEHDPPDFKKLEKLIEEIKTLQKEIPWEEVPTIDFPAKLDNYGLVNKELFEHARFVMKQNGIDEIFLPYIRIQHIVWDVLSFFKQIKLTHVLAQRLKESNRPWKQSIPVICQELTNDHTGPTHPALGVPFNADPLQFIKAYNEISDSLFISNDTIKLERALVDNPIQKDADYSTTVPSPAILSNIFFDFLLLGGQDYYGFCEHCDKFFVIQRKGRKKYCSDICRVNANKAKKLQ